MDAKFRAEVAELERRRRRLQQQYGPGPAAALTGVARARQTAVLPADVRALNQQRAALAQYPRVLSSEDRARLEEGARKEEAMAARARAAGDESGARWVEAAARHKRACLQAGKLLTMHGDATTARRVVKPATTRGGEDR